MDPAKVEAIRDWETPGSVKEVRSFIGFSNFYREFIDHFATVADPLIRLTKTGGMQASTSMSCRSRALLVETKPNSASVSR